MPFQKEVETLIKMAHKGSGGDVIIKHNGINTVIADLKDQRIYWASMSNDINDFDSFNFDERLETQESDSEYDSDFCSFPSSDSEMMNALMKQRWMKVI